MPSSLGECLVIVGMMRMGIDMEWPAVEREERDGFRVTLFQDECPTDPREDYDHYTTMYCAHRRYTLGDVQLHADSDTGAVDGDAVVADILAEGGAGTVVANLYLYDHSGITISMSAFGDPWDSGCVGVVAMTPAQLLAVDVVTDSPKHRLLTAYPNLLAMYARRHRARMLEIMGQEVEEYDQYLTGDIYGYAVETAAGDYVDGCWGHYGYDYAWSEALAALEYAVESARETRDYLPQVPGLTYAS